MSPLQEGLGGKQLGHRRHLLLLIFLLIQLLIKGRYLLTEA